MGYKIIMRLGLLQNSHIVVIYEKLIEWRAMPLGAHHEANFGLGEINNIFYSKCMPKTSDSDSVGHTTLQILDYVPAALPLVESSSVTEETSPIVERMLVKSFASS
jgi:hypothetical protein